MNTFSRIADRHRRKSDEELDAELLEKRRSAFDRVLATCHDRRDGWITSERGRGEVVFVCREGSNLPETFRSAGYDLEEMPGTVRMVGNAIVEEIRDALGKVIERRTHGGNVPVRQFRFEL